MGGYIYQQGNPNIRLELYGVSQPILEIVKSISNITLAGAPIAGPIPGASISYTIIYSNSGNGDANSSVIYDALPADTVYLTNYLFGVTTGWTQEYSTNNGAVNQGFSSGDYQNTYTAKSNVTWIRWKKGIVPPGEKGTFIYKVIIK